MDYDFIYFTKEMKKIIKEIKKEDSNFNITEEEIENCKKENPSFNFTIEDLKEILALKKLDKEIEKISNLDKIKIDKNIKSNLIFGL